MKNVIKKLIYAAFSLIVIFGVWMLGYFFYMAHHVNKVMSDHFEHESLRAATSQSELEEDSKVRIYDLNEFLLFSTYPDTPADWLRENQENINRDEKFYYVKKTIAVPALIQNDCEAIYCLQHRVGFEKIPSLLWRGLIGIEDMRFVHHAGVDLKSILRAIVVDIKEMKFVQGGSTITQQLVKNLFFSNERSLIRKIKEIFYALYLESRYSKDEILNAYFNEVSWGTMGGVKIRGFYAASMSFFGKRPEVLSDYEVAILISMLKGTHYYSPIFNPERLKQRAKIVYNKLRELKFTSGLDSEWSEVKYNKWVKTVLFKHRSRITKDIQRTIVEKQNLLSSYEFFIFLRSINQTISFLGDRVKDKDIAVKAYIGKIGCQNNCQPFEYYSKFERDKEVAMIQERHQVGSVLKPIFYQIILNNDKQLQDLVSTEPITLKLFSGEWTPRDSHQASEKEVTVLEALRKSQNIPLIRLASEIGFEKIENEAILYLPQLQSPLSEFPAQMLGAIELSAKDVFETYQQYIQTECLKMSDNEYHFEKSLIFLLSKHDETTISKMIFPELRDVPFFGKTGTTNHGLDNWYISYDRSWLYVIWFGLEGDRRNQELRIAGSSSSFRIFQNFLLNRGKRYSELSCPKL